MLAYNEITPVLVIVHSYGYTPFGRLDAGLCYDAAEEAGNPFQFTGQWYDVEISQYYLRARMYDPTLMRFTARDPVTGKRQEPLTLHKYLYCGNDSANYIDPSGLYKVDIEKSIAAMNEGTRLHSMALLTTACGVDNQNWKLIGLGIGLENLIHNVVDYYQNFGYNTYTDVKQAGETIYDPQMCRQQQNALFELAGRAQHDLGRISMQDAYQLLEWANEYGAVGRGPEIHWGKSRYPLHIHIGPIEHILIDTSDIEIIGMPGPWW